MTNHGNAVEARSHFGLFQLRRCEIINNTRPTANMATAIASTISEIRKMVVNAFAVGMCTELT